ncbi:hypothetical protein AAFF_G00327260 [Aldrovandia affinis]|uniref:Uncharacterized protein n=1 Tax=Aldrovandia affinis TaxID=143900 RepID=A0AAD7X1M2_9TELE|nr:hypothetical protein AAFF_G00327260 [Aldrovandia affinis]
MSQRPLRPARPKDKDCTHTTVTQHHIETSAGAPIRQRGRWLPLAKWEEAEAKIRKMAAAGIIQPSESPWVSPAMLLIAKANQRLNPVKCSLFSRQTSFLGHVISERGESIDPAKVEAVEKWPSSTGELKNRFLPLLHEPETEPDDAAGATPQSAPRRSDRTRRRGGQQHTGPRPHTQRPRHRSSKLQATGSNQQATEPAILITGDVTINSIHAYEAVEDKAYLPPDLAASPDDVQNPDIQTSAPISQEKHTMCSPPDIQSSSPSASPSASLAAPPTQPSDERTRCATSGHHHPPPPTPWPERQPDDSVCHVRPAPSSTPPSDHVRGVADFDWPEPQPDEASFPSFCFSSSPLLLSPPLLLPE